MSWVGLMLLLQRSIKIFDSLVGLGNYAPSAQYALCYWFQNLLNELEKMLFFFENNELLLDASVSSTYPCLNNPSNPCPSVRPSLRPSVRK